MQFRKSNFAQNLLLEEPMALVVTLGLVGLILLAAAHRRRQRGPAIAAGIALVLAAAVWVLAATVETGRERMIQRCHLLVQAVAGADGPALRDLFEPDAQLLGPDESDAWVSGSDHMIKTIDNVVQTYTVSENKIRQLTAMMGAGRSKGKGLGQTLISVRTKLTADAMSGPRTSWRITWRLGGDDKWRIMTIVFLEFNGAKPVEGIWR